MKDRTDFLSKRRCVYAEVGMVEVFGETHCEILQTIN